MIKLYRINTGSCGGCDSEIALAVATDAGLSWASSAATADALLLTGPITLGSQQALQRLLSEIGTVPILAVGQCAIDGSPFGRGGVKELADLVVRLRVEGCPVTPQAVAQAIREAVQTRSAA